MSNELSENDRASSATGNPTIAQHPIPDTILLAREARGLTQTELAKITGISQARLSKMEDNLISISNDDISALSSALKYPRAFFFKKDMSKGVFNGLYRRRKSLAIRFLTQFNAAVSIRASRVERLARKEAVMKSELPRCDTEDFKGGAKEIAAHIRQFLGIPPGPIKNLVNILEDCGIVVIREDFGSSKIDGVSIFTKNARPVIFINSAQPKSRQIFTLVHELAHMVMHHLPTPEDVAEMESDTFTAEFLMPSDDIRPQFHSIGHITLERLQSLKLHWNVSMGALARRARDLGFIDQSRYTSICVMMSQRGYRTMEPHEDLIKIGTPTFERELIDYHLEDLSYSQVQLMELLDMNEDEFHSTYPRESSGLRILK